MSERIHASVTEVLGRTPLVRINRLNGGPGEVVAKLESLNPMSSVKDRIGLAMIQAAERDGKLRPGGEIIEPTSGNTGIALAFVGAARGYRVTLVMPESMSRERRAVLRGLGAKLVLTEASQGMKGAIAKAEELLAQRPGAFMPGQFDNPANPEVHYRTTAEEIWADTDGRVDVFVAGVGTGGTLTGVGGVLKERNPEVKLIAVEPADSPVLSGGSPGKHGIQGIGAGFVPGIYDGHVVDDIVKINSFDAIEIGKRVARTEGFICGISSGAAAAAAATLARDGAYAGKRIVVMMPDTGERYISTLLFYED